VVYSCYPSPMLYLVTGFDDRGEGLFAIEVDAPNEDVAKKYVLAALRRDRPEFAATADQVWRFVVKRLGDDDGPMCS
jgi:hypothetical protein